MSLPKSTKQILKSRKLAPHKKLGQNFLVNPRIVEQLIDRSDVQPDDTVIEVGVGLGALTKPLAARVNRVIGLEIDKGIIQFHEDEKDLPGNVVLLHQDVLKADLRQLYEETGDGLRIMANLPYSISNPFIFKLIENYDILNWAVLMLQKEVAERLCASPGTREYGVTTVLLNGCAGITRLMNLGPQHFHPKPKVDSQVVRLDFRHPPEQTANLPAYNHQLLRSLVNAGFQQRRKKLANGLASAALPGLAKNDIIQAIEKAGFQNNIRGEMLDVSDWVKLCNILAGIQQNNT